MTVFRHARTLGTLGLLLPALMGASPDALAADPSTSECLAASENASRLQADKKLRKAREKAAVCAAEACPVEVHDACRQRVADLNKAIPTIAFQAKDAQGADLTDVRVSIDGLPLVQRLEGKAIWVDPGKHTFRFEVAGQAPVDKELVLVEGEKDRREAITIGTPRAVPQPPPPATPAVTPSAAPPADQSSWSTQKTLAVVAGGVGIAGVVLGSALGLTANSKWVSAQSECNSACGSGTAAQNDASDAHNLAKLSNVSFAVGGVALAGAVVLWFTAPGGGDATPPATTGTRWQLVPVVGSGNGGAVLKGAF